MNDSQENREMPHAHLIHIMLPMVFVFIWFLDTNILLMTVWLNEFVPFIIRLILFITFLSLAFILMKLSHDTLFSNNQPSDTLITTGILARVRHPLYLGILFIYVAFIFFSISLICIVVFILVFLVYNKMANYEENTLIQIFGEAYLEYKKKVPKWIPKLF